MEINQHNYEHYFLMYIDNELSADEKAAVNDFIMQYPNYANKLETLQQLKISPDILIYENKFSLYKLSEQDQQCITYLENEMTNEEKASFENKLFANTSLQSHVKQWQGAFLTTPTNIEIAPNFKNSNIDTINYDAFVQGIKDVLRKNKLKFDDNTCNSIIQSKLQELATKGSEKEKAAGQKFLSANKSKPGVITTASGLQYEVVTMGAGAKPTAEDTVVCHYKGTLVDGKEFDNSYTRGEPISFPVGGVIKGWTEALQLMPKGSKWKLYIPSELGYGDRSAGPFIGPGMTLIFEVELLGIE